jgi:DNA-binding transcriptional LysR family regulator
LLATNAVLDLLRGEADIAVRGAVTDQKSLLCRKLGDMGWSLYAGDEYLARRGPIEGVDLAGHDLVAYDEAMGTRFPGGEWYERHAPANRIVMRCSSIPSVRFAVLAGLGVGVLPCCLCDGVRGLNRVTPEVLGSRASGVRRPSLRRRNSARCFDRARAAGRRAARRGRRGRARAARDAAAPRSHSGESAALPASTGDAAARTHAASSLVHRDSRRRLSSSRSTTA